MLGIVQPGPDQGADGRTPGDSALAIRPPRSPPAPASAMMGWSIMSVPPRFERIGLVEPAQAVAVAHSSGIEPPVAAGSGGGSVR